MHALVIYNFSKFKPMSCFLSPHNKEFIQAQNLHNWIIIPHKIIGGKWIVEKDFSGKTLIENHRKCLSKNVVFVFLFNAMMLENVVTLL